MDKKAYKARVELSLIVEFGVEAERDYEAEESAEAIVRIDSEYLIDTLKRVNYSVPNAAVRCIEVEEYEPENE